MHPLLIGLAHKFGLTQTTFPLRRLLVENVALVRPHPLQFSGASSLQTLRSSPVCLHLWHVAKLQSASVRAGVSLFSLLLGLEP